MWSVYRLARDPQAAPVITERAIGDDIAAFANAMVRLVGQAGRWVKSSARGADGGYEVWFGLAQLPSAPPFAEQWALGLTAHGLTGRRVTNRN
jgi:hypothetical protein